MGAPILAGMLTMPSWPGALIGIAGVAAFLTRQPLRLALSDRLKGRTYPRSVWAARFAGGYAAIGIICLLGSALLAHDARWLTPLIPAAGLGLFQFAQDVKGSGRRTAPELCGAAAMSLLAASIVLAGNGEPLRAALLSLGIALQAMTAVLYASARVRLERGLKVNRAAPYLGHVGALGVWGGLILSGLAGWPAAAAFGLLAARCVWGLSCHRSPKRASMVGVQEVGYAVLTLVVLVYLTF